MKKDNEITLEIPTFEILLVIGIVLLIIGILMSAGIQYIEFAGIEIWLDNTLGFIFVTIGSALTCGYITRKTLKDNKKAFYIGLAFGIIGVIFAIFEKTNKGKKNNVKSIDKYEDLKKLAELRKNGTITQIEFETEKNKLLS